MQAALAFFFPEYAIAAHEALAAVGKRCLELRQPGRQKLRLATTFLEQVRKGTLNHLTKRIGQGALLGHNRVAVHDGRLGGDHMRSGLRSRWHGQENNRHRQSDSLGCGCDAGLCHGRAF